MIKKSIAVCAAAVLLSAACTAQGRSFEFVNQNIKDVLFIFSTQLGKPILADSTVEGETSFQFAGTDTEKAFNAFLQANRLFAYEDSGVLYISKISVTRNGDGTLSLVSYDASAAQIIERIAHATGTTITYETLPSVKNSICADNVTVTEALEILLKPYSDYSVITEDKYIFVRKESAARKSAVADAETKLEIQEEMQDTADDESSQQTFTAYISKAPLKDALERLFSLTEESYTSFVTDIREIEHVQFAGKNFDESLSLIADGGGAKAVKSGGMWFIFQEETQNIQSSIKGGSAVWKHHTLKYSSFGAVRPVLEARFPYMKFYELPDKSSFTFAIEEKDEKSFDDFIALIDRPAASSVIKLKYIKAEDLIAHLPPSVKAEDIVLTGNNSSIFFKGTDENRKILLKELANVDIPQKRIRYDMLIVQFQKTANLNWSLKFEADNLVPGHRTLLTGALANLLNLNFDVVTVFGYLFALKFNTALAENKASVFADTTLHGVSGENIQFRNTSTYRFRDSTIDPETGEPKYTGVTREIVSGLVLDINGWISGDGMITTTVTASVSKQGVDVSATTGNPPPTSEKLITTQVRSRSGEPVILSGLTQNDSTISDEGIPFLKRIPILNRLFSTYLKTDEQSEMVIYLVPHLEKDSDDENEALNLEKVYGDVTERYSYTTKGRTVTFTDGKGSDYVYSFDEFGRLTQEKNRIDGIQNYTYNENGELKTKKDFEGNVTAVSYDTKTRTKRTQYADGTESVIVYDECGNVLSATNESGALSYTYDKAGKLIKQTDSKTGETVSYFYDKAGRRTRLVSRERDISYGYGKNSELLSQKDRLKQLEIHYKYDVCGREIERRFGNGVRQLTFYDKAGRTICIRQVNSSDRLLSGEAYAYDKLGRRSMTVNEKGLVTIYKYDNQSRLETVYYPFNEDIKETARKEADKQGLYFQPSQGTAENYFLSTGELLQLKAVAECIANGRSGAITVNQVVWKESYTYDPNGNRTSKTTSWGTVQYAYDKENRLTESGNLGMSESVKYTYDKNGNLLRESAARYRKDYVYNAQNRMSFSDVQDSVLNTRNFTEYAYDAFGRRIETKEYLGDYTRNLYDGFSFDVLGKSVLQSAYSANIPAQKYRDAQLGHPSTQERHPETSVRHPELVSGSTSNGRNERGSEIGTRYRYIDDTPLVPMTEAGKSNGTNAASSASGAKTRSRPNNEYVLYSYGEPVAMTNDNGTLYFGTDILGSVHNVTDKYGAVQADYSYDAFGSPYLGNLENDIGFGYCGKVYDVGTGLYDYGFRDYSPVSARFTTIDPIRDGSNWFSYCMNDAVNYYDPDGLKVYNKTDYYILIKLENDSGYVILAPHSTYDGKNVSGYPYQNGQKEIDSGKVDGIEISKGIPLVDRDNPNGTLYKINDKEEIPGCTSITIKQTKKGVTAKASFGSKIRNAAGNIFKDSTKEPSSYYGIQDGSKTGDWFQVSLPQETLGERLGNQKNCYVRKDELEQMQQNEINKQTETAKSRPITEKQSTNYANPQYFSENNSSASSANNVTFNNINFDGSGSVYIGFNGFSMGCSK